MTKTALDRYEEIVIEALVKCNAKLRKSFKNALIKALILHMVLPRKINFTQMGNNSDSCEQRFRQLYERNLDWLKMNRPLMDMRFRADSRKAIAIDASFIKKSGNKTPYIGKFWSGCDGCAKRGLEILGIGVIDIDEHDCMMMVAEQTPDKDSIRKFAGTDDFTLVHWYLAVLNLYKEDLLEISSRVVVDAWFAKKDFINQALKMGFQVITRLRDDASLSYSIERIPTGKKGRPKVKGDRIDFKNLDLSKCEEIETDKGRVFGIKAYSTALRRDVKVVVRFNESGSHKIYMSTDLGMGYIDILEYYTTRFQIEFCFRNARQFTGLQDSQARSEQKLDFAFNASLTAVNVAKVLRHIHYPSLSIGLLKSHLRDIYLLKRIFSKCGKRPNLIFNANLVNVLFGFEADAS